VEGQTSGGVDWKADLERRSRLATPADTARGLFFSGLLSSIKVLGDEALAKRCLEASGQTRFIELSRQRTVGPAHTATDIVVGERRTSSGPSRRRKRIAAASLTLPVTLSLTLLEHNPFWSDGPVKA